MSFEESHARDTEVTTGTSPSNSMRSSQDLLIDFDHPSGPSATRCSDLSTPIDDQHFLPVHSPGCHAHPRHERIMGLGASIPEELFEHILFHVGYNYIHDSPFWTFALVDPGNKAQDIKACSLVCRHWANQCRRHMFTGITLIISSPEQADTFIKYATPTRGCTPPSLIPVHQLIREIQIEQTYDVSRSFCHRFHIFQSQFGERLSELRLLGPIPPGFSSRGLDTPHWSLPPSAVTPSSLLPYREITLSDVHLPSYRHAAKYVKHFGCAYKIRLYNVTWDTNGHNSPVLFLSHRGGSRERNDGDGFSMCRGFGCTDNLRLCIQVAVTHTRSLIRTLQDDSEGQWLILLLGWFRESFSQSGPPTSCEWRNNVQGPEGLSTISVQLGAEGRKRNRELVITLGRRMTQGGPMVGASAYVAGIEVWFEWDEREEEAELEVDVDALMTYLDHFTMLRVVNLSFSRYDDLLTVMRRYRPVSHNPQIHQRYYVLAYMRDRDDEFPQVRRAVGSGYDFVGIDPITLSPTGESWAWDTKEDIVLSLLKTR